MAVYKITRFEIREGTRDAAERAMHDLASSVRKEQPRTMWTAYRDPATPTRYLAVIRSDDRAADEQHEKAAGTRAFAAALAPLLAGELETAEYELVTSSDLQRRHRR